jgi:hypothetical protein
MFSILLMDKALRLRGSIRIKSKILKDSLGQQNCSENLSFEARKASHTSFYYFYFWNSPSHHEAAQKSKESIHKKFCYF